jgi:nitrogen regulatory protein P-II 2
MVTNRFPENTTHLSLVTIVAESILETRIVRELEQLGVTGLTVTQTHGGGARGSRSGDIGGGNVKVETVVSAELAPVILAHVEANYFEHHAVIAWVSEVGVLRGEKYV